MVLFGVLCKLERFEAHWKSAALNRVEFCLVLKIADWTGLRFEPIYLS